MAQNDIFDEVAPERDIFDEVSKGDVFDQAAPPVETPRLDQSLGPRDPSPPRLDWQTPARTPEELGARNIAGGGGDGVPMTGRDLITGATSLAAYPGRLAYSGAADLISKAAGQPEYGGNLKQLSEDPLLLTPTPAQKFINETAKYSVPLATVANLAKAAPEFASMIGINPTGLAGKLLALGFSADMVANSGDLFKAYADEYYKPESEQDKGKMAEALAGIIQTVALAPLAAKHGVSDVAVTKGDARRVAIKNLVQQLNAAPETAPTALSPKAQRELGLRPITAEPFLQPGVPELADAALKQSRNIIETPESGQALQALRGAVEGVRPVAAPTRAIKPDVQGGQISFAGEAGGIPNARQSAVKPTVEAAPEASRPVEPVAEEVAAETPEVPPTADRVVSDLSSSEFFDWAKGKDLNAEQARLAKEMSAADIQKAASSSAATAEALRARVTDAESANAFADAANLNQFWNETLAKSKSVEPTKTNAESRSELEQRIEAEIGKEGEVKSTRADWAEINADIESGMTREQAIQKYLDDLEASRKESDTREAQKNADYLNSEEAKQALMTPAEYRESLRPKYNELLANYKGKKKAKTFEQWLEVADNHENILANAANHDAPLNAEAVESSGLQKQAAENGYVRRGDRYEKLSAPPNAEQAPRAGDAEMPVSGVGGEPAKTSYIEQLFDQVEKTGSEITVPVPEKNRTREALGKAVEMGKVRGLDVSTDGKNILIRPVAPAPTAQKVRIGKSPQLHTVLRETTDPKFPDEKIFEVQNDRTGEKFEVDAGSMERVTERPPEAKQSARDLDAELRAAKLDPSSFPDAASKKAALKRQKGLIENIESLQARIRGKGSELRMGVPAAILDTALEVARLALVAGRSVKDAVDAAIKHIRENHKGDFREMEARRTLMSELERPAASERATAQAPARQSANAGETLDDVYKIFEPSPKKPFNAKQAGINIVEAFRTGLGSKFRPLNKLAEDIAKSYGLSRPKDIAGIFEQLKGSQGKGEAEVYRFDRDVSSLVKGDEKDFNAYIFLRRSLDRLNQDAADIAREQADPGSVGKLNRRAVSNYTIPMLESKLALLSRNLGPEKLAKFRNAAEQYQQYMDKALRLQVESGRMSPEVYNAIKSGNQFYAPFKVMKYLEETSRPEGVGSKVDTMAKFTQAMQGIESSDFKLGDMLGAARQSILISRILADKNSAMRNVAELAPFDTQGLFIKKLAAGQDAPPGMNIVNVLENGQQKRYAVNPDVADALQIYGGTAGGVLSKMLSLSSIPFRAGATALNIPFQVSNLMADVPRQALISKYGVRNVDDLVRYPLDFAHALYSSMAGDLLGRDNKLFQDFLDSGVAGTTVQEYLTPEALRFHEPSYMSKSKALAGSVLTVLPRFAEAIEQTSKILGVKRAMRFEGVESGAELAKQIPEAITELRRYSGSPDFGRQGKWIEAMKLNLLYMFLNARIQGLTADLGRLGGKDGPKTTAVTWGRLIAAVGLPTAYLYSLNSRPENKADYEKRPLQERQNYWLIPKNNEDGSARYITTEDGEKIRDYWRIPKRESSKWIANYAEAALSFAEKRDKKAFGDFANSMIQEISPVNISGENATEKLESVGSGLNPLIKAPLELATGRDLYRHRDIMSDQIKKASPEQQFNDRTPEAFKALAQAMPDASPEFLRSPIILENLTRNLTAGLLTQFLPRKPIEGRKGLENNPLAQRFQSLPYTDNQDFKEQMSKLERDAADEQLIRHRAAVKLMEDNKNKPLQDYAAKAGDIATLKTLVDLYVAKQNGATAADRQVLALPARQRAMYVLHAIEGLPQEQKNQMILDLSRKRILTETVMEEMAAILKKP